MASSSSRRPHRTPEPVGARRLVAAEGVEVAADRGDIDRQVGHGLGAVHQHQRTRLVGQAGHLDHGVDGAQRVGHVGEGDQLRLEPEEHLEHVLTEHAVVGDRDELEVRVLLLGQDLPRDQVRVVLHLGEDDHVAPADVAPAPRVGDEVDRLGGVPGPDDLAGVRDADQTGDLAASTLVGSRGALGQLVDAAMDVGVVAAVVGVDRLDDHARLLRGRRGVQVDQRVPVHLLVQDREVRPQHGRIEGGRGRLQLGGHLAPTGRRRPLRARGGRSAHRRAGWSRSRSRGGSDRSPPPRDAGRDPCRPRSRSGPTQGRGRRPA